MMNLLVVFLSGMLSFAPPAWLHNMKEAKQVSKKEHKYILLNFSGSDWCGPCIRMEKEIFENQAFQAYAADHLVLVNADFPRLKKHQPDAKQVALNEEMAEQYNKSGVFPLTLLLDENGKVLKKWTGMPAKEAKEFIAQLQIPVK